MHNAVKGFLGVWGALSLSAAAMVILKSGPDAPAGSDTAVAGTRPTTAAAAPTGSTVLEQAILDAFPAEPPKTEAERQNARNAADFVGAAINAGEHLCARLIEMQEAAPGQYGVGCIMRRDGTGRATYLIDSRTGTVDQI